MARTHYLHHIHDSHGRGRRNIGPTVMGKNEQLLSVLVPPSPAAALNVVVRGAASGAAGLITQVISTTQFLIEPIGVAVTGWSSAFPFGETVNFDNGGSSIVSPLADNQSWRGSQQFALEKRDARISRLIPPDRSDTPYWDRQAKKARKLTCAFGTVTGIIAKGDRVNASSGGSFTVKHLNVITGGHLEVFMVRATGTIAEGDTLAGVAPSTFAGTLTTLGDDTPQGVWREYAALPNQNDLDSDWEFTPRGNATDRREISIGPENQMLNHAYDFYSGRADPLDRGFRYVQHSSWDDYAAANADAILGGVGVQVVKCTGTFPGTWTVGETLTTPSGWSAKVHSWNGTLKYLFCVQTNGKVLEAEVITGATSGATADATGAALGWQRGSTHWNNWWAQIESALDADGSLAAAQPLIHEALFCQVWETELAVHAPSGAACPILSTTQTQAQWAQFIADVREEMDAPDMTVVIWLHRPESQPTVTFFGFPVAAFIIIAVQGLPQIVPGVRIVGSDHYAMAESSTLFLRTDDYLDLGGAAWRSLVWGQLDFSGSGFEVLPVIVVAGSQSQAVGFIPAGIAVAYDRDPDLWKHSAFGPGLSTVDDRVLSWKFDTRELVPYSIDQSANTFWNSPAGTCGFESSLLARWRQRYSNDPPVSGRIAIFKAAVSGSCLNASVALAAACWDPDLTTRPTVSVSCTVTLIAAAGILPARARFTAVAGTFSTAFAASTAAFVSGSANFQGLGGNNTPKHDVDTIFARDPDGAWVELTGTDFAAEGPRAFTLSAGPPPIWPEFREQWAAFISACFAAGYVPRPVLLYQEHGESDLANAGEYSEAMDRFWSALLEMCTLRPRGDTSIAKCITQLHSGTPLGTDEQVATIRAVQAAKASALGNCALVDPSSLAMEINGAGTVIRETRQDNGVHHTSRSMVTKGFMVDAATAALVGVPGHPNGSAAVEYGAVDGGVSSNGSAAIESIVDPSETASASASISPATAATLQSAVEAAMLLQPDVAGYSVTKDGRSVQRRSLQDQLLFLEWLEGRRAQANGFTQTLADFN